MAELDSNLQLVEKLSAAARLAKELVEANPHPMESLFPADYHPVLHHPTHLAAAGNYAEPLNVLPKIPASSTQGK